jgi:AcrR family transcriptional regulator
MDDLARELGMSKKTLYTIFPSKTSLLEAVLRQKFAEVDRDLGTVMERDDGDFAATLHRLLDCMHRHTGEIQPAFVRDIRREAPELFQIVEAGRRDVIRRHFGKVFEQGRKAGHVRKDVPVKVLIEVLLSATDAIVNPAKLEELGLTPKTGYAAVVSVVLRGALTDRGREAL